MSIALDYTSRIAPNDLHAADVSDVFRYLAPSPGGDWKRITMSEYRELRGSGINVTLNWEWKSTDWNNGLDVGYSHGLNAGDQARGFGYPHGCTIFGSADYDMPWNDWKARGQYYARGFASGVRAYGYEPGVYGPWDVLQWVHEMDPKWMAWQAGMSKAWSGGRNAAPFPACQIRQLRQTKIGGMSVDINEIRTPYWGQAGKVPDMAEVDLKWGEVGPPNDPYFTTKGAGGTPFRGPMAALADLIGQIGSGHSLYAPDSPAAKGYLITLLEGMDVKLDRIVGAMPRIALTDEDRNRIDRLAQALDTASGGGLPDADRQTLQDLLQILNVIGAHLK